MCRYKPCTVWVLLHSVLSSLMILFCMGMYLFVGGSYPSTRFDITWKWSMLHNMTSVFITLYSATLIYKEALNILANRICILFLGFLCLSAGSLCAAIWPPITKTEYQTFLELDYKERREVPVFIDWFQFTQGCCGIDNYKDYIRFTGTRLVTEYRLLLDPLEADDFAQPNVEVLTNVVFDVPRSCCALLTRQDRNCGQGIPYVADSEIDQKVNNLTKGCYQILYDIIYNLEPVQISMMFLVFRVYPILDAVLHIIGVCVHAFYYNRVFRYCHSPEDPVFYSGRY